MTLNSKNHFQDIFAVVSGMMFVATLSACPKFGQVQVETEKRSKVLPTVESKPDEVTVDPKAMFEFKDFSNKSIGNQAKFSWIIKGKEDAGSVTLAYSSSLSEIESWKGTTPTSGMILIKESSDCASDGRSKASEKLSLSGQCAVDISAYPAWSKIYFRLSVTNLSGQAFLSEVRVTAKVPSGMVFVSRYELANRFQNILGYDFAVDAYPASLKDNVTPGTPNTFPNSETVVAVSVPGKPAALNLNRFAAIQACTNRTQNSDFVSFAKHANFRLMNEKEWAIVANDCTGANCGSKFPVNGLAANPEWTDALIQFDPSGQKAIRRSFNSGHPGTSGEYVPLPWNTLLADFSSPLPSAPGEYAVKHKAGLVQDLTPKSDPSDNATQFRCAIYAPATYSHTSRGGPQMVGLYFHSKNYVTGNTPDPSNREFFYGLTVSGTNVYVVTSDHNIHVFDVADPKDPKHVRFVTRNAPTPYTGVGVDPVVKDDYLYVVETGNNLVAIYDISNRTLPTFVTTVNVGVLPAALVIKGRYGYTANSSGNSVSVLDLQTPSSPSLVRSVATIANAAPKSLAIVNNTLAVALYNTNQIQNFTLANPSNPVAVGTIATSGLSPAIKGPTNLDVKDKLLIVGHGNCAWLWGSETDRCGITVMDYAAAPVVKLEFPGGLSALTKVSGSYVFGSSYYNTNSLRIIDLNDLANPIQVSSYVENATPFTLSEAAGSSVDGRSTAADLRTARFVEAGGFLFVITGSEINYSSLHIIDLKALLTK